MKLLQLGGTRFAGRHLTALALERGHDVTLFHRGNTGADLFPEARRILGDRKVDSLPGGTFDAVVDWCGFLACDVRRTAEVFADARWYGFVSSISVHPDGVAAGTGEDGPLRSVPDPEPATLDLDLYGENKVACEVEVRRVFGDRACVVRPGYVVGPHDPTDRFPSLVRAAATPGVSLFPPADVALQFVDARDLATFVLDLAERRAGGTFTAVHPPGTTTVGDVVALARGPDTVVHHLPADVWLQHPSDDREAWWPLWAPDEPGFHLLDSGRAAAAGLRSRPVSETVRDTLAWLPTRERPPLGGPHGLPEDVRLRLRALASSPPGPRR